MNKWLNHFSMKLLAKTGMPSVFQSCHRRMVTIINYHDPAPEVLKTHLECYARHFHFIAIGQLDHALANQDFSELPDNALLVTFDDGHIGNYRLLPLLKEYHVPAVIYVTAGLVGTCRHFWWLELRQANEQRYLKELKTLSSADFRSRLRELCDYEFEREYPVRQALTVDQLREMAASGITIGAHSVNHPILNHCTPGELRYECLDSRNILENILDCSVDYFALPNGDYDDRVLAALKECNYRLNRTITTGWNTPDTDPLRLKNFGIFDFAGKDQALLQSTGVFFFVKTFLSPQPRRG